MNILIVYAHPEPRSLNGSLKDVSVGVLKRAGHEVVVSDLYEMGWKSIADGCDFPQRDPAERLVYAAASGKAYATGTQAPDVAAEQEKIKRADVVLFQFPLWWFSVPAILKGWIDRVFAYGFAYGVGEHNEQRYGDRYGEGMLKGKRSMLLVTVGSHESHYSPRGIDGPIDDLLFPIQHGILYYPGMDVLPPFVVYKAHRTDAERYAALTAQLQQRLLTLATTEPIAYRMQNGGDYELPALTLKPGLDDHSRGFAMHIRSARTAGDRKRDCAGCDSESQDKGVVDNRQAARLAE